MILKWLYLLNFVITISFCWDENDFILFDLIEEVNQNFYELLGIDQYATQSDIKRSYRKLSLQLHPDRNKEADAEVKFRQLVSVYEILKDEQLRIRYNEVLINGIPDWRQPIYYYRRVRKMGLLEISIALFIILTTGHFITLWAIYLEKKFELQELIHSKRKKERKFKKSKHDINVIDEDIDQIILDELGEKPKFSQLLPILFIIFFIKFFIYHLISTPNYVFKIIEDLKLWRCRFEKQIVEQNGEDRTCDQERPKKAKFSFIDTLPSIDPSNQNMSDESNYQLIESGNKISEINYTLGEWTEDELDNLVKGVIKFPGGTPDRWEKISQFVGRPVKEVLKKANDLKTSNPIKTKIKLYTPPNLELLPTNIEESHFFPQINANKNKINDNVISIKNRMDEEFISKISTQNISSMCNSQTNDDSSIDHNATLEESQINIRKEIIKNEIIANSKKSVRFDDVKKEVDAWNRLQQKQLEAALITVSKENPCRWEEIAALVPGKTKEECIFRYKHLSEIVKRKRQAQQ